MIILILPVFIVAISAEGRPSTVLSVKIQLSPENFLRIPPPSPMPPPVPPVPPVLPRLIAKQGLALPFRLLKPQKGRGAETPKWLEGL